MGISLDKVEQHAPELLSLAKSAQQVLQDRDLTGLTAEVAIVLDFSGSMRSLYSDGSVQKLVNKVLALATQLDDDGEIDLFIFESRAHYLGKVSLGNFRNIVADYTRTKSMGTTDYAGAFRKVVEQFNHGAGQKRGLFGSKKAAGNAPLSAPVPTPALALFVTDGAPDDQRAAAEALTAASFRPIFWQLISIGRPIPFLQRLDDLDGRYIDNADYFPVASLDSLTDEKLFGKVFDEYPAWVEEERKRGQIA
jgi:hypothetical protein